MSLSHAHTQDERTQDEFAPAPENERRLRDAFSRFATGVTIVTTRAADGPVGMTANSFSSVSLDPALVLWCLGKTSDRYDAFAGAERFAIHVLDESQQAQSNGFARDSRFFDQVSWFDGADGVPAISACLARFDCRRYASHDAGDHIILVGEVLSVTVATGQPLLFALGGYGTLARR